VHACSPRLGSCAAKQLASWAAARQLAVKAGGVQMAASPGPLLPVPRDRPAHLIRQALRPSVRRGKPDPRGAWRMACFAWRPRFLSTPGWLTGQPPRSNVFGWAVWKQDRGRERVGGHAPRWLVMDDLSVPIPTSPVNSFGRRLSPRLSGTPHRDRRQRRAEQESMRVSGCVCRHAPPGRLWHLLLFCDSPTSFPLHTKDKTKDQTQEHKP
jgi:hypothetical protein